jgi:hypothetical protein
MLQRTKTIDFKKFVSGEYAAEQKELEHNRNMAIKKVVVISGYTAIIFVGGFDIANASDGIDQGARTLYAKLLSIGKWIVIVKGAISTVNNVIQEDIGAAKKNFLGYLVVYLILKGLPWGMDQVDHLFEGVQSAGVEK